MSENGIVNGSANGSVNGAETANGQLKVQVSQPKSAVLDSAHLGDIEGAFGKISVSDPGQARTFRSRMAAMAAILGPGIIVMVGDNDAGGVATYAQAGQSYGYSLLWVLLLLIPVLIVNQEMVVRLGAVTGVGHARLINERFGRGWGWFSVGDLFILNFLTLVTEFIGVALASEYLGVSKYYTVPLAAIALILIMATGSFRRWERAMFVFIAITLLQIPMFLLAEPQWERAAHDFVVPGIDGGISSGAVLLIIAMVGTTVAPWQLFFQQSNIVDKRITPRFIGYERADTVIGSLVVVIGAAALLMTADYAARVTGNSGPDKWGDSGDAGLIAEWLGQVQPLLGKIFAIVLLDASIIGAAAVTLATSYAFGDTFGLKHSLPHAPLGLMTTAVQALAGLLLPSASVFLLLLCNDKAVLGPWVNKPWLNIVAGLIVGVLLFLSGILMATTLFPDLDVVEVARDLAVGVTILAVLIGIGLWWVSSRQRADPAVLAMNKALDGVDARTWRMPPLALLEPVKWSPGTKLGMLALRGYLVVGAILLVVKAIQLAHGN
ncbi:Probable manganese transport transmembrane protein [Mycobacteroides abscessus subsp. bolletii]|uniref:Nramp family divalent metal transporter n=1 Tax=Mycobacteroides abscessus TaxID=36809 RepID=UPI0009A5943B|nr:Nramp family divalent metal transporter [Mycobacteroides abscessus]SKJ66954.1 Probable manganese transport transmembrane protein [Mycobacteroides abscessus subsp. bolletii]